MKRTRKNDRQAPASKGTLEAEVFVSLMRTADTLQRGAEDVLKPTGLSGTQYNVLRILRGAGEQGLACSAIGCRMISRDPDITRLLDRMESRGLIARTREEKDRRIVTTRITPEGLELLRGLDKPVEDLHRAQLSTLPQKDLRQLFALLEKARAANGVHPQE